MVQFKDILVGMLVLLVFCECSSSLDENPKRKMKKFKNNNSKPPKDSQVEQQINNDKLSPMKQLQNLEIPENLSPCQKKHCGAGRVCKLNEDDEAKCVCILECPVEVEERRKVCSNLNSTWNSDCELHRMRCNCEENSEKCEDKKFSHLHVQYYGACKHLPVCTESEMADFPRRMREWLYHIMEDLAEKEELSPHFSKMVKEAETNMTKRWSNAAVWKWCDLDGYPHDRAVSTHELFPIRAPLMNLEHCIAPFLNKCDPNNDHMVTLAEWGNCLEIPQEILEEDCGELKAQLN